MTFLENVKIKYKLFLIGIVFSIPMAVLLLLLINEKQIAIDFADKELQGSAYLQPLVKMLDIAHQHRSEMARAVAGGGQPPADAELEARASAAFAGLQAKEQALGSILNSGDKFQKVQRGWQAAFSGDTRFFDTRANDALIADIRALIAAVGDSSNLILDPDLDSYYLMDAVLIKLPDMIDLTNQISSFGSGILNRKKMTPDEKTRLIVLSGLLKADLDGVQSDMVVAFRENPAGNVRPALAAPLQRYHEAVRGFLDAVNGITEHAETSLPLEGVFLEKGHAAASEISLFWGLADTEMDHLLSLRIKSFQTRMAYALITSAVVVAIAYLLIFMILKSITEPILSLSRQIREFRDTLNLKLRISGSTGSEIGELARMLNGHIENLSHIIGSVSSLADKVNSSSNDIAASVGEQSAIFTEQSASLSMVTESMENLSQSSSSVAQNAASVADTADSTLVKAEKGVVALDALKEKMFEIQKDNRQGMKEILELDAKSKDIGKAMGLIADIASQTKMIAFNAALEAAASGETGKRFAVVATEIRRLADNVMESTAEIDHKTREIQQSVQRLVVSSEKGTRTVDEGLNALAHTIDELVSIVAGAKSTTEAAAIISLTTQQENSAARQILTALKEIDTGIGQSSVAISQTSDTSSSMKNMSDQLKVLVEKFKLNGQPAAEGRGAGR